MKVGFIGLGNVGGKLAGSLIRNNFDLTVRDLDKNLTQSFKDLGATVANSGNRQTPLQRWSRFQLCRSFSSSLPLSLDERCYSVGADMFRPARMTLME